MPISKLICSVTLALFLNACGGESTESHLENAKALIAEGDQATAIIELKNAIKQSSDNSEARLQLGLLYLASGHFLNAEKELEKALALTPESSEARIALAQAFLRQNREQAIAQIISDSPKLNNDSQGKLLAIHAIALFQSGEEPEASVQLSRAKQLDPQGFYTLLAEALSTANKQDFTLANTRFEQLSSQGEANLDYWLLKGHVASASRQNQVAVDAYSKVVELSPNTLPFTLILAQSMVKNSQFEQAEAYVNRLLKALPNHGLSNQLKAVIRYQDNDFQLAFQHAQKAIQGGFQNYVSQLIAGLSAYRLGNYEQALPLLERVAEQDPNNVQIQQLLLATQFRLGRLNDAVEQLADFPSEQVEDRLFIGTMSQQLNQLGRLDEALALAEKAADNGGTTERLRLAMLKLKQGDESGLTELKQLLADNPDDPQAFLGIILYEHKQQPEATLSKLEQWLRKNPNDNAVRLFKGSVLERADENQLALNEYQQILKNQPDDLAANLFSTRPISQLGNVQKAFEISYQLKQKHPQNNLVFKYLLNYAQQLEQQDKVHDLLMKQTEQSPNSISLRKQLAQYYAVSQNHSAAIAELKKMAPEQLDDNYWQLLASLYLHTEQSKQVQETLQSWLKHEPLSAIAHTQNILHYQQQNDLKKALKLCDDALVIFPNEQRILYLKALLLLENKALAASQASFDQLAQAQQQSPIGLQLQANIYQADKKHALATQQLEQLYKIAPSLRSASMLVQSYRYEGKNKLALRFLEQQIETYGEAAIPLKLQQAELILEQDPEHAANMYQAMLDKESGNIIALNNLAWIHLQQKQYSTAQNYAEQAYELAPAHPAIQDTLGYILLKNGDAEKGKTLLEKSYREEASVETGLHLVEALITINQPAQAQNILAELKPETEEQKTRHQELEKRL